MAKPSEILDRVPPWSCDAERAVLSSVLLSPQAFEDVVDIIQPADFYDDAHRRVFQAMSDVHESGRPVDLTIVRDAMIDSGDYDRVGGVTFLSGIMSGAPTASHARYHASIVREKARRRRIIDSALQTIQQAYACEDSAALAAGLAAEMDALSVRSTRELATAKDIAELAIENYERRKAGESDTISTGLPSLDKILGGGFARSDYVVLAARTSFGKTALALSLLSRIAQDTQRLSLLFSIEMTRDEIADRLTSTIGELPTTRMKLGRLSPEEERKLVDTAGEISQLSFRLDDSPSQTVASIARTARREARQRPLSCVMVDYVQLLEATKRADRRDLELAHMSRKLKSLSQELGCPVIVLAQLNREADGQRPRTSHIREADAIGHEANCVLLLDRPHFDQERSPDEGEPCNLIVDKNRNGPRGVSIPLLFFGRHTRFVEAARPEIEPATRVAAFDEWNEGGSL